MAGDCGAKASIVRQDFGVFVCAALCDFLVHEEELIAEVGNFIERIDAGDESILPDERRVKRTRIESEVGNHDVSFIICDEKIRQNERIKISQRRSRESCEHNPIEGSVCRIAKDILKDRREQQSLNLPVSVGVVIGLSVEYSVDELRLGDGKQSTQESESRHLFRQRILALWENGINDGDEISRLSIVHALEGIEGVLGIVEIGNFSALRDRERINHFSIVYQ